MEDQGGRLLENLRDIDWEIILVQDLELWEVLLMAYHMEMSGLMDIYWGILLLERRKSLQGYLIRVLQEKGWS